MIMPPKKKDGRMTNAEKQRSYHARRRLLNPENDEKNKIKDRERFEKY